MPITGIGISTDKRHARHQAQLPKDVSFLSAEAILRIAFSKIVESCTMILTGEYVLPPAIEVLTIAATIHVWGP
jgi:hypothetical protein